MVKNRTLAVAVGLATTLALGSAGVVAEQSNLRNPYAVQPDEVLVLNKSPMQEDIAKICATKAAYKKLTGAEHDSFISKCTSG